MGLQNSSNNHLAAGCTIRLGDDAPFDLYYNGADGLLHRLPVGTLGALLKVTANGIEWILGGNGAELSEGSVLYEYIQDVTSGRILGRYSPGAGVVEELTATQVRDLLALGTAALANTGTSNGNVPVLDANGKLNSSVIPAVSLSHFYGIVADQTARLALTSSEVQPDDWVKQADTGISYVLTASDPSIDANWIPIGDASIVASDIIAGIIATARLATGTANNTTYLRGDQTWQPLPYVGLTSVEVTGTTQSLATNSAYRPNNASLVTLTLPTTATAGNLIRITGVGAGGWRLAQNTGQQVHFGSQSTTAGTGGRIDSTHRRDSLTLECVTDNSEWQVIASIGNFSLT